MPNFTFFNFFVDIIFSNANIKIKAFKSGDTIAYSGEWLSMKCKNRELVGRIIKEIEQDANDEEIIHLLLESKVASNTSKENRDAYTFGQRAADKIAGFAGSWTFIIIFVMVLLCWIAVNIILVVNAFDPYPFILLNLVLSCVAAIQAPLVMMSQNRQEQKDRLRSENDYKVNLKTEIVIEDLHHKIDELIKEQQSMKAVIQKYESERSMENRV